MEFYANEIVQDLAHHPYADLGAHSDSDSEAAAYNGLETILEETSGEFPHASRHFRNMGINGLLKSSVNCQLIFGIGERWSALNKERRAIGK